MGCSQSGLAQRLTQPELLNELPVDDEQNSALDPLQRTQQGLGPFGLPLPQAGLWDSSRFRFVRKLQDANRNHGWVDEFVDLKRGAGVQCAVKRMPKEWATAGPRAFSRVHPESAEIPWADLAIVQYLNSLGCSFSCEHWGIFVDQDFAYVVSSLASDGDLFTWSSSCPLRGQARETAVQPLMVQLFAAVQHLHDLGIAHRDICLENILLHQGGPSLKKAGSSKSLSSLRSSNEARPVARDSAQPQLQVKLIDFGMATLSRNCSAGEVRGKPPYQAPEMHRELDDYDAFANDTFALGVVLFAFLFEFYPWNSTEEGVCASFSVAAGKGFAAWFDTMPMPRRKSVKLASTVSEGFRDLMAGLLEFNPELRSNLGEECWNDSDASGRSVWNSGWLNAKLSSRRLQVVDSKRSCGSLDAPSPSSASTRATDTPPPGRFFYV